MELIFILFFQMFMGCYIPKYHSFYLLMGRANAAKFFFYIIKLIIEIKLRFTRLCLGFFSRCCDKILGQKQLKETRCIWLPAGQTGSQGAEGHAAAPLPQSGESNGCARAQLPFFIMQSRLPC